MAVGHLSQMQVVAFDSLGTIFELTPLEERLTAAVVEAWYERLLHAAAVVTTVGDFQPFDALARATLRTTLAKLDVDSNADDALAQLDELPAAPDALEALEHVRATGCDAWILTNGGRESTRLLLERAGLDELIGDVLTAADVRAYKPDARVYNLLPPGSILVAAHAWDVLGARNAGYDAVWVDRAERVWPFPGDEPLRASDLAEASSLALQHRGRATAWSDSS